jgi:hypothetical protein
MTPETPREAGRQLDVERLAVAVETVALREHTGMDGGGGIAYTTPGAATGPLDLEDIAAEYASTRTRRKRTDWTNVVVDEGDEAP